MRVLGIETSCDETSVAIIDNGRVRANEVFTQDIHAVYGGVVPEIASREHIKKVAILCKKVIDTTVGSLDAIDLIAVTDRPGLAGALLVGVSFAYGLHVAENIPLIGVNHLEGHIAAVTIEHSLRPPFFALVASGGHTSIYRVAEDSYSILGQTIDDAAGEAFDKVGKLLGFPYPAGPYIEREARRYTGSDPIEFPVAQVTQYDGANFSFSGLKTSVKYYVQKSSAPLSEDERARVCYSFQEAVVAAFVQNLRTILHEHGSLPLAFVGGVACNGRLREALSEEFSNDVFFPSPKLCADNAAMIAQAGARLYQRGVRRFPRMEPTSRLTEERG
ncbi:tRNA (adenosine(37)-N6)-threonylcarbamoyltransferase complex transferase subunit TsaD [Chitinivibrio alkaliphilus]|uniref:tRNA N6-adenosine threonylcarbamoyltransferase n=1 Tax=Chitinivibrio alkaliphilus ACht1 TaxID=1313304 RepID=U7D8W8_9BACT|nr:tRNA (adenosine(37)-N6)-threonylcarbamoyltransferase complex transferase subunit TsaD [Chitinivibrio alkaliphilus]ERP32031.1 metalloendopeptidase, glycoprotease family [Chitinivibrio alkaliphilus ACht1]